MADPEIPEAAVKAAANVLLDIVEQAGDDLDSRDPMDDANRVLEAAASHLRAATLADVDAVIPRGGSTELALWLERHGLGVGAGPAAVLASLRQDLRALAGTAEESP